MFDAFLFQDPAFDDELDMVRPYVLLYEARRREERRQQQQRRQDLILSLMDRDVGPPFIQGVEVAR